ncbi:IclR family transcriptional regulator (plasmid) [Aminobacter sp. SR38]|jgi:IclR family acetate operon transcriptional repressor|uniref:IclR family transcriptional regulator n=1 Tax=Aminobacter sp. SR38 TaxID=2774562 RepID=UPI0017804AE1|nr:IclR family transcriptional regulator [Aminobacter sp. SR38]QOF75697.1 IclR family transcriptional regulator [Aminobacter sp. SR38]
MKTLDTALQLLRLFETEELTLSVTQIADATGMPKSKVSRLLAVFRTNGFLEQDPQTRRYRVGLAAFELGANYVRAQPLARDALPILRSIVEQTGHSTTLSVMRQNRLLHIMAVEGPHYIDGRWRVGSRLPVHATSAGKVILAGMEPRELDVFLTHYPLRAITPDTVTDPARLREQVAAIRESGVAVTRGESSPGLAAIAVPVIGPDGATTAALGLIIPDQFFSKPDIKSWTALLHREARRLSIKQGAGDYSYGSSLALSAAG